MTSERIAELRELVEGFRCPWGEPGSNPDYMSTKEADDLLALIDQRAELLEACKAALAQYEPRLSPFEEGRICKQLRAAIENAEKDADGK